MKTSKFFFFQFIFIFSAYLIQNLLGTAQIEAQFNAVAEDNTSEPNLTILKDVNGDGKVAITAFGDSLTFGVGDGTKPGDVVGRDQISLTDGSQGYPRRLQALLSIPVANNGKPGEEIRFGGIERLVGVSSSSTDFISFMQGINDVFEGMSADNYEKYLQKAINIMRSFGKVPVIATLPKPCCDHLILVDGAESYSAVVRNVANANEIKVADLAKAWETTCKNKGECELYNIPEGLHPNALGYAVIAQTFAATFLGIDIFSADGAQQLADASGRSVGEIVVKPGVQAVAPVS